MDAEFRGVDMWCECEFVGLCTVGCHQDEDPEQGFREEGEWDEDYQEYGEGGRGEGVFQGVDAETFDDGTEVGV